MLVIDPHSTRPSTVRDIWLRNRKSSSVPPHVRSGDMNPGEGRNRPVFYACASNAARTEAILTHVHRAIPVMHKTWDVYEFTDHNEFEEHVRQRVPNFDNCYAGICVELNHENAGHYFGVMCRLALSAIPSHVPTDIMKMREMHTMMKRLITFGRDGKIPLVIDPAHPAWNHFCDLHLEDSAMAHRLKDIFITGAEVTTLRPSFDATIRDRLVSSEIE